MITFFQKILIIGVLIVFYPFALLLDFLFFLFPKKSGKTSILIINNAKIGDMVCSTPIFREIKASYPSSRIVLLANQKTIGIVKNNPHIDEIIPMPKKSFKEMLCYFKKLRRENFSGALVLVPGTLNYMIPFFLGIPVRSATVSGQYSLFNRILAFLTVNRKTEFKENFLSVRHYLDLLEPIGIQSKNLKKEVFMAPRSLQIAEDFLFDHKAKDTTLVGFSVTAGNKIKEWPLQKFVDTAEIVFNQYGYVPVLIGSKSDKAQIEQVFLELKKRNVNAISATNFALEDLPALLSHLKYFISVDTGTLYIANALGIPVLDIAGPCNIHDQMPLYEKCEVVYIRGLPGWPYSSVLKTITKLSEDQMRCINDITPQMVIQSFKTLVQKYG